MFSRCVAVAVVVIGLQCEESFLPFLQRNGDNVINKCWHRGGSPGLVVMGNDSCSRGYGFKSQSRILDGHFSHCIVVKVVMFA